MNLKHCLSNAFLTTHGCTWFTTYSAFILHAFLLLITSPHTDLSSAFLTTVTHGCTWFTTYSAIFLHVLDVFLLLLIISPRSHFDPPYAPLVSPLPGLHLKDAFVNGTQHECASGNANAVSAQTASAPYPISLLMFICPVSRS